jgi:anaerobic selenocysteine-containing dehydrogenase
VRADDAERLGVKSGDRVTVSSRIGQISAPIEITDDMLSGVISLPHGFGHGRDGVQLRVATKHPGVSVNDLTDDQRIDVLSGNAVFSTVPVTVIPAAQ